MADYKAKATREWADSEIGKKIENGYLYLTSGERPILQDYAAIRIADALERIAGVLERFESQSTWDM